MAAEQPRVGWIGTGVMGSAMCGHALTAGYELSLFTRTRRSAEPLLERGATWCDSPATVAAVSDIVCSMVGYPADVRGALLGEDGALAGASPGSVVVDFTTSEPGLAREVAAAAQERGLHALDAPVSGGDVGARNGTLVVMVGGDREALDRVRPLIDTFSQTIVHTGGAGAGQHTKMVNQVAIAGGMIAVCEALLYAQRAGLDVEATLQTISGGAAGSWSLSNYAPRMLRGDFAPGFKVDHFVKDLGIALGEARRMHLALPGTALAEQLYVALQAQGGGELGTHALVTALARLNDVPWDAASA